jgi:hypothetical protein
MMFLRQGRFRCHNANPQPYGPAARAAGFRNIG